MKIVRTVDGKRMEFELSSQELGEAHSAYHDYMDVEYVRNRFDDNETGTMELESNSFQKVLNLSEEERESAFESIAVRMRELLDDDDCNYDSDEAFYQAFEEYLAEVDHEN